MPGVFILITDNPAKLLPTVRSRCTELALQALPEALLRRELQKQYPDADVDSLSAAVSRSAGYLGQAKTILEEGSAAAPQTEGFVKAYAEQNPLLLTQTLVPMEKWKRDQLISMLQSWLALVEGGLMYRSGLPAASPMARQLGEKRPSGELLDAVSHLKKAIEYTQSNVSPAAVCAYLAWTLR